MRFLLVIATLLLTVCCWGLYGPTLHQGQYAMRAASETGEIVPPARWKPFMCVGLAYFAIAVVVPTLALKGYGEKGLWTLSGIGWSLAAGGLGAVGALGIILAFNFGGNPVFVMPLVFGGAPVVNSFLTITMSKSYKQIGPIFYAGLIMVALGAVTVLIAKPESASAPSEISGGFTAFMLVLASVGLTVASWGSYGPVLHLGQLKMQNSRLRPLICVGLSYFAIAVIVPGMLIAGGQEPHGEFNFSGTIWSLMAGSLGALGALGIILSFTFGGKPVFVMPLVFGGAPVVNSFAAIIAQRAFDQVSPLFYAGLILVAAGAAIVLAFAPRGPHKPDAAAPAEKPAAEAGEPRAGAVESGGK